MVTYTAKLNNHTIPNRGSQVIDSRAATSEGFNMVNSYNQYKVESLKTKRYTLQSSNPMHPRKRRVISHNNFSQMFMSTENHLFLSLGGTACIYNSSANTNAFF